MLASGNTNQRCHDNRGVNVELAGRSYEIVWAGRGPLTDSILFDYHDCDRDRVVYWPPPLVFDYRFLRNGGGWGVYDPFCQWLFGWRRRPLRNGVANKRIEVRLRKCQRRQSSLIGERAPASKLKEEQVIEMRVLFRHRDLSINKIAKRFGVSTPTVAQIVHGDTWRHLPTIPPNDEGDNRRCALAATTNAIDPQDGVNPRLTTRAT